MRIQAARPHPRAGGLRVLRFPHRLLRLGTVALLAASAGLALAAPSPTDDAVLTPDIGPRLEAAFARAEPTFHLRDAAIKPRQVQAHVCRPSGACLDVLLTPPNGRCPGHPLATWCVQFPAGVPPDAELLFRALDGDAALDAPRARDLLAPLAAFLAPLLAIGLVALWLRPRLPVVWQQGRLLAIFLLVFAVDAAWTADRFAGRVSLDSMALWGLSTSAWLWIWWLTPLALGGLLGLLVRCGLRRRLTRTWSAWLPLATVPLLGAWLAALSTRIGAMDGGAMALVATLAFLAVAHRRWGRRLPWLVSLAAAAVCLLGLELAARLWLPPPPVVEHAALSLLVRPSPRPDRLPVAAGDLTVDCALHGGMGEETARCLRLDRPPADKPWVLHLGDSMLFGSGVSPDRALPAQLAERLPRVGHVNAGVPGTSIDVELALLQRVLQTERPNLVVLYAMPGNDADEVDAPTESCAGQAPLAWDGLTPHLRCPQAIWPPRPWYALLLQSRLPLPIAALAGHSWIARHLMWLQFRAIEPPRAHDRAPPTDVAPYQRYLQALRALLRQAGIPLQIVIMPLRRSQYREFTEPRRRQLGAVLRETQAVVDTQPAIDAAVAREGESAIFLDTPSGDIHLNSHGIGLLAAFLAPQLALPQAASPTQ